VRSRAVRTVVEHESDHASRWAAIASIAAKIGSTPETLRLWVKRAERENRELRQANEILRKASAYFALAELDRRQK
jgi:transposase-like protein